MSFQTRHDQTGTAPVASLDALPALEAHLVRAFRRIDDDEGPEGGGTATLSAGFRDLLRLADLHAHRPLRRLAPGCMSVGADEAVLAHFVATAATGDREDAFLIATLLVRADIAPALVARAQMLGLAVLRLTLAGAAASCPAGATRH